MDMENPRRSRDRTSQFSKRIRNRFVESLYKGFPAFRSRNFRLYIIGQVFSLSGTFMTQMAIPWLIYDLTKSAWLLGLSGFLGFLPSLILIPFSGVLSDRWDRKDLLKLVQILGISVSATLTLITFLNIAEFWSLLILSILGGVLKGLDMPVRHAFVVEMVEDRVDLSNAIAINSTMLACSRLMGPALGGLLLATVGVKFCFLYDTISYVAAILALAVMTLPASKPMQISQRISTWNRLKEGFNYVADFLPVKAIILLLALQGIFGFAHVVLLPIFAAEVLQGGEKILGWLSAAPAFGAVLSSIYLSQRSKVVGLERLIALCPGMIGVAAIAYAFSSILWVSLFLLVIMGGISTLHISCSNTVIQTIVEDSKRGRVMSFYSLSLIGMLPICNLFAGTLAHWLGAPNTMIVSGIICISASAWFYRQLPLISRSIKHEMSSLNRAEKIAA
ncbi:MFS transporter [Tumidithrix elongata RA019]|uniref:MFS transporter n=1 Tax=Tumidithrix elongata BACA0141 TaxID=2716417 RepID=A0AAW9Q072_9CYAN|nr:MFS transporter [Tumidithrix elongata RA019]